MNSAFKKFLYVPGMGATLILVGILILTFAGPTLAKPKLESKHVVGLMVQDLSGDLNDYFKLEKGQTGILVTKVFADTNAAEAGLEVGDIITSLDKQKILSVDQFLDLLYDLTPNSSVKVKVIRDAASKELELVIPEALKRSDCFPQHYHFFQDNPDFFTFDFDQDLPDWTPSGNFLGVIIKDLNQGLREFFSLKSETGVLVFEVVSDSPAAKAGLKAGDIILDINDKPMTSSRQVRQFVRESDPEATISIRVQRKEKEMMFDARLETRTGKNYQKFIKPWGKSLKNFHYTLKDDVRENLDELKKEMEQLKQEMEKLKKDLTEENK